MTITPFLVFKFGFVELFVCALPALFALSPLRGAPPKGEPWDGGKHLLGIGIYGICHERLPLWGSSRRRRVRGQNAKASTTQRTDKPQFSLPSPALYPIPPSLSSNQRLRKAPPPCGRGAALLAMDFTPREDTRLWADRARCPDCCPAHTGICRDNRDRRCTRRS